MNDSMEPGWLYGWGSKGRNSVQGRAVNASSLYQLFTRELGWQLSWWCACLAQAKPRVQGAATQACISSSWWRKEDETFMVILC